MDGFQIFAVVSIILATVLNVIAIRKARWVALGYGVVIYMYSIQLLTM